MTDYSDRYKRDADELYKVNQQYSKKVEYMQEEIQCHIDKLKEMFPDKPITLQVEFYKVTMDTLYYLVDQIYDIQMTLLNKEYDAR